MATIYARLISLALFVLATALASAQSLEDKVSEARKLQAQSLSGMNKVELDSLVNMKMTQSGGEQKPKTSETEIMDSLIAGPKSLDYGLKDSSGQISLSKRYDQRVFQNLDRTAFSSAIGAVGREYILGPGDAVTLSLWGDKERQYNLLLNGDGAIFLEGVGLIPLAGMNVAEAEKKIHDRLSRIYSGMNRGTASMNLTVGRSGPKKVFVLGEVKVPGGYVFTGHTSVISAIYFAQGPTNIGTVRNLVLNRSGKKFPLDLYDYLMRGEILKPDILQDGDILFAGRAEILVEINGDVGRPAIYELKKGEGIKDLLTYSGGLNPTAARQKMTLRRVFEDGRVDYLDLSSPQEYLKGKQKFEFQDGDKILVEKSSEASENFYTIIGPVKYPGTYQAEGVTSVPQLIQKAGGLHEEAYLGRVHVVRFHPDGSSNLYSYNVEGSAPDSISLKPRDNVILYSLKDMHSSDSVEIAGAVFKPGRYEYRDGMSVKDLVMQAGGFLPKLELGKALLFRGDLHERKVEQLNIDMDPGLVKSVEPLKLKPHDMVHIPVDPRWYEMETVILEGLFLHPGKYALLYPGEKLSEVIQRTGGFKENAYVEGARFFRKKDGIGRVGVDVAYATRRTRSKANISLLQGDSIYLPERTSTVKVIGEISFETSVLYKNGASVQYYIEKAGGFTRRSEKNRVVVQYANGESSSEGMFTRKPDAGSVIFVPRGPEPKSLDWFGGINAIMGTLGIVLALILSIQAISK